MARQRKWHVEVRNVRYLNTVRLAAPARCGACVLTCPGGAPAARTRLATCSSSFRLDTTLSCARNTTGQRGAPKVRCLAACSGNAGARESVTASPLPAPAVRTYTWVETGTAGIPFLTNVIKNVDTNKEGARCAHAAGGADFAPTLRARVCAVEFEDKFTATWTGSYFDLYEKRVRTEVRAGWTAAHAPAS